MDDIGDTAGGASCVGPAGGDGAAGGIRCDRPGEACGAAPGSGEGETPFGWREDRHGRDGHASSHGDVAGGDVAEGISDLNDVNDAASWAGRVGAGRRNGSTRGIRRERPSIAGSRPATRSKCGAASGWNCRGCGRNGKERWQTRRRSRRGLAGGHADCVDVDAIDVRRRLPGTR